MRDDQKKEITLGSSGKKISVSCAFNAAGIFWNYLGVGGCNVVYWTQLYHETDFANDITLSPGKYVCKIQTDSLDADASNHSGDTEWRMSLPERAVRVYAECNSGLSAISYSISQKDFYNIFPTINLDSGASAPPSPEPQSIQAWISPFVDQKNRPTSKIIINALAELYNKTGRVLLDGVAPDNIMVGEVTAQNNTNDVIHFPDDRIVFSDVDYAVKLRRHIDDDGYESEDSGHYWQQVGQRCYRQYFAQWAHHPKHSVVNRFIKTLLFLAMYYPEIRNVSLLPIDDQLVSVLANAFDEMRLPEITEADNLLQGYFLEVQPISLLQRMRCDKLSDDVVMLMKKLCPDIDIHASDITLAQQADWMYWALRISHLNGEYLNKLLTIDEIDWIKVNLFLLFESLDEEYDPNKKNRGTRLCLLDLYQHNMPLLMRKIVYAFYNAPIVLNEFGRLRQSSKSLSADQQKLLKNSTHFFTEHSSDRKTTLIQVLSKLQGYCLSVHFATLLYFVQLERLLKLAPFFDIFTKHMDDTILSGESKKNKSQRELLNDIVVCATDQQSAYSKLNSVVRDCPRELINAFVALYLLRYTDKTEDVIRARVMSNSIQPTAIISALEKDPALYNNAPIQLLITVLRKYFPLIVNRYTSIFAAQNSTFQGTAGIPNGEKILPAKSGLASFFAEQKRQSNRDYSINGESASLLSDDMPKEKQGCPCTVL